MRFTDRSRNIGNDDEWTSTSASVLSSGQILISKEEDYQAKVLMYLWTPPGTESPAATPTFSPAGGTYTSSQSVTISDSTSGATIYYTTNGTTPTTSSTQYTGPIAVSSTATIEAIAAASGYSNSDVASATYTINVYEGSYGGTAAAIPGTIEASNYDTGGSSVAYNQTTSGGQTGYRSDNSGAIEANSDDDNSPANGYDLGWTGAGQWYKYTVNVATAGSYTVSFSVASPSGQTDGFHLQNASGTVLSGDINVPNTSGWYTWQTVTATVTLPAGAQTLELAEDNGGWNLEYMTFASTTPTAATPTFSPAAGTYTSSQSVTISDSTTGATIYYTTNSTTPTTSSTQYTGAITIYSTETIEAIAVASGYNNSNVGSATYTINTSSGPVVEINAGGSAVSGTSWVADTDYSGGTEETWTNSINTSNVTNPAPTAVYQSDHFAYDVSSFTYTIPGLTAGGSYTVRLHFCENFWTAAGDREFNVSINGTQVLTNFDVYATAGGKGIANIQQFSATANHSGQIVIVFTTVVDNAMISGIEIDGASSSGTSVSLTPSANTIGTYSDGTTFSSTGGLDGAGNAYSSSQVPSSTTYNGITYLMGAANANNVVKGASTAPVITLTSGIYSNLYLLGTGMNGNQTSQTFTVTYSDGTTTNFTQSLSDWWSPSSNSGEVNAIQCSYID